MLNQIQNIVNSIQAPREGLVSINGQTIDREQSGDSENGNLEFTHRLSRLIYSHFYCKGTAPEAFSEGGTSANVSREEYLEQLRSANTAREGLDRGWLVHSVEKNGSILAQKNNFLRRAMPGDFVKENLGNLFPGGKVKIVARKEWTDENGYFYYVFGNTVGDGEGANLARIYINIHPDGSGAFISALATHFNRFQIPFQFKCLSDPSLYERADSSVLYLDKRYVNIGLQALFGFYPEIREYIRKGIPLFCKRLGEGIGFAENPPNSADSFGISRSSLIAHGITRAIQAGKNVDSWLSIVLQSIEENNLSIDEFYLNPKASFPYQFIGFN